MMRTIQIIHLPQLILLLILLFQSTASFAETENQYVLQENTYKALNEVREAMDQGKNDQALKQLKKLLPTLGKHPYDTAVVNQTLGYVYHALEQIDKALNAFIKSVETGELPDEVAHDIHYIIAQLAIYKDAYKTGLNYLQKWFNKESAPGPDAHILAASVYFELEKYKDAIPHIKDAIKKSDKPPLNWQEMLLAAYYQTKQLKQAAALLEKLIVSNPEHKEFWLQLIATYQQLDNDRRALAINELAYSRGLLKKDEIINLAKSYLYLDMPYKAGDLISREMNAGILDKDENNMQLLVNSWLSAQEHNAAIIALEELNKNFANTEHQFRLARLYVEKERWQDAVPLLKAVTSDGKFKQMGEAWLLLGMCHYELNDNKSSLASFQHALKHKDSREQARWWVEQIIEDLESESS